MTRQTFSCTAMSTMIETRIAKAKAAPNCAVKTVVWVMKPGPMALVAMRNIAPRRAPLLALVVRVGGRCAAVVPGWGSGACVMVVLLRRSPGHLIVLPADQGSDCSTIPQSPNG